MSNYMLSIMRSGLTWFGPLDCARDINLANPSFMVVIPCPEISMYLRPLQRGIIRRTLNLAAYFHLVPTQRMCGGIPLLHSNQLRYFLYCSTETIWHAPVPAYNSRRFPSFSAVITHSKQHWKFMYLMFDYSNICWERPNELIFPQQFLKPRIPEMNKSCLTNLESYALWSCGAHREIFIRNTCFIWFYRRYIEDCYSLYARMHISLLSNPVYNNNPSDNFLDETRSCSAVHSTS